jgi:YidC/Oxa1 family membrane protein insertase
VIAYLLAPLIAAEEWLLEALHSVGLGWGLAIIGLTLFVRLCTVPLVVRQFRLHRHVREHGSHGIHPLAPLLPLLIQIAVFVSLYYVMRTDASSGLFGDEGFLFIPDLGSQPHGAVLAALLVAYLGTQVAASLIATRALGGGQRGFAIALPLLLVGVVARVPAGLGVYWVTSSLWGLGQQLVLRRAGR